jgi:Fe-Mn family superoxide dismutase
MPYTLPELTYSFDALEPHIDAKTMEVHYTKHHQAYLDNFVKVIAKYSNLDGKPIEELLRNLNMLEVDEADRKMIKNHGGGYANHNIYWAIMGPEKKIDAELTKNIEKTFSSMGAFKEQFNKTAMAHFGSGWTWLVKDNDGKLEICTTINQDSPLSMGHTPILALDLWEHAYYLKYQNRKAEYIENWWNIVKIV